MGSTLVVGWADFGGNLLVGVSRHLGMGHEVVEPWVRIYFP